MIPRLKIWSLCRCLEDSVAYNKGFVVPEIDIFVLVFSIYHENPM